MSTAVGSARRYYLGKRRLAAELCNTALELVWQAKQEAETGTALPDGFPSATKLSCAGYTTAQDLDGADTCELTDAGLTQREAAAVLAALAPLLS